VPNIDRVLTHEQAVAEAVVRATIFPTKDIDHRKEDYEGKTNSSQQAKEQT
jgi:hypothetical protein